MLIQNNMYCKWIEIKKIPEYNFYDNIGDVSVRSLRYHSNDTKEESLDYVLLALPN